MRKIFTFLLLSVALYVNGQEFTLSGYTQPNTKVVAVADSAIGGVDPDAFNGVVSNQIVGRQAGHGRRGSECAENQAACAADDGVVDYLRVCARQLNCEAGSARGKVRMLPTD